MIEEKQLDKMDKAILMETCIWVNSLCFEDIYNEAPDETKQMIDNMSYEQLARLISEYSNQMQDICEEGIMQNWTNVARTVWEEIDVNDYMHENVGE